MTVDAQHPEQVETARAWTARAGLKWSQIELSQGTHPLQPMITFWGRGSLADQIARATAIARELADLGALVVRVKVEMETASTPSNFTGAEAIITRPAYFESHFKLNLNTAMEHRLAAEIAAAHNLHLSRNARRSFADGSHERFLTLRSTDCTASEAAAREQHALRVIQSAGLRLLETESELVVHDSNLALDAGWGKSNA